MAQEYEHAKFVALEQEVLNVRSEMGKIKGEVQTETSTRVGVEIAAIRAEIVENIRGQISISASELTRSMQEKVNQSSEQLMKEQRVMMDTCLASTRAEIDGFGKTSIRR